MLERLHALADERVDFAFETTGASRTFAPWIKKLVESGYEFHCYFSGCRVLNMQLRV
jgi:hypothetical protein